MGGSNAAEGASILSEIFTKLELEEPAITEEQLDILKNSVNPVRLKNHPITLDVATIEGLYREL